MTEGYDIATFEEDNQSGFIYDRGWSSSTDIDAILDWVRRGTGLAMPHNRALQDDAFRRRPFDGDALLGGSGRADTEKSRPNITWNKGEKGSY